MNEKQRSYYWIVLGVRAWHYIEQGKFATAAKLMRWGLREGIFEPDDSEGSSWRTSILLHMPTCRL